MNNWIFWRLYLKSDPYQISWAYNPSHPLFGKPNPALRGRALFEITARKLPTLNILNSSYLWNLGSATAPFYSLSKTGRRPPLRRIWFSIDSTWNWEMVYFTIYLDTFDLYGQGHIRYRHPLVPDPERPWKGLLTKNYCVSLVPYTLKLFPLEDCLPGMRHTFFVYNSVIETRITLFIRNLVLLNVRSSRTLLFCIP